MTLRAQIDAGCMFVLCRMQFNRDCYFVIEAEPVKTALTCPEDLISRIQPYLNAALVREFSCIYKFVVVDDNGAAIYHLDLKNGMILSYCRQW